MGNNAEQVCRKSKTECSGLRELHCRVRNAIDRVKTLVGFVFCELFPEEVTIIYYQRFCDCCCYYTINSLVLLVYHY